MRRWRGGRAKLSATRSAAMTWALPRRDTGGTSIKVVREAVGFFKSIKNLMDDLGIQHRSRSSGQMIPRHRKVIAEGPHV